MLAALVLPPAARPFHTHADEALAGGLDVAAADGQSCLSGIGVVHALAVVLDVRERLVDGPSVAYHHLALPDWCSSLAMRQMAPGLLRQKIAQANSVELPVDVHQTQMGL